MEIGIFPSAIVSADSGSSSVSSASDKDEKRLKEACDGLESLFIYYLLKEMRASIPKSGFISGGKTEEMYTSMLDFQLAQEIASRRGIGISSVLFDQLTGKIEHKTGVYEKKG